MSDVDRKFASVADPPSLSHAEAAAIDAGLRAYMLHVYNYMGLALAATGAAAFAVYLMGIADNLSDAAYVVRGARVLVPPPDMALQSHDILLTNFGYLVFVSPLKWVIMLAPLALVFWLGVGIDRLGPTGAQAMFWTFSLLMGISLSVIFVVFTHASILRVFFLTAASFGALSLFGYTTRRDLSGLRAFLIMGLVGVVLGSVLNLLVASSIVHWAVSVAGILVFAGLTAWDTQRLKSEYLYWAMEGEAAERSAVMGALSLYLNFVNLFTLLLSLLGQRDD
jgi:FtsH-binding integral membrane protein